MDKDKIVVELRQQLARASDIQNAMESLKWAILDLISEIDGGRDRS